MLLPADTLSLIDFGAAKEYPKRFVDDYLRMVRACADRNRDEVILRSTRMGFLTGDAGADQLLYSWPLALYPVDRVILALHCLRQHGLLQVCELVMLSESFSAVLIVSHGQCLGEQPEDARPQNPPELAARRGLCCAVCPSLLAWLAPYLNAFLHASNRFTVSWSCLQVMSPRS